MDITLHDLEKKILPLYVRKGTTCLLLVNGPAWDRFMKKNGYKYGNVPETIIPKTEFETFCYAGLSIIIVKSEAEVFEIFSNTKHP